MNTEQFKKILECRISSIRQVLGNKAKEYAIGDRLYNFKRAAEISRTTPKQALAGMFMKHLVSVLDLVEGSIPATEHMINEKVGDAINYLILLEAILKESSVNTKHPKRTHGIRNFSRSKKRSLWVLSQKKRLC